MGAAPSPHPVRQAGGSRGGGVVSHVAVQSPRPLSANAGVKEGQKKGGHPYPPFVCSARVCAWAGHKRAEVVPRARVSVPCWGANDAPVRG
jgi:hypothetical protein